MAELIMGMKTSVDPSPFRFDRFKRTKAVQVTGPRSALET